MIITLKNFIFLLAITGLTGCAKILSPEKGENTLNSEPSGAEVYNDAGVKIGTTPINLLTISKTTKSLKIKQEGYIESNISVRRTPKSGLMFLDALLLCIPCPVDFSGNDLYKFSPVNPIVRLRKEIKERDNNVRVVLDDVTAEVVSMNEAKLNSHTADFNEKGSYMNLGMLSEQDDIIKNVFNQNYLEVVYQSSADASKSGLNRPKIFIKPVISEVKFNLKGRSLRDYSGSMTINMKWNIYKLSDKNSAIASLPVVTSIFRNSGSTIKIIDQLVYESSLDLLENDTLYDYLKKVEKDYMSDSKGQEFKVTAPPTAKYETTKEALKNAKGAVVTILGKQGFGSGFIISSDGYILTNYHVIEDEKNISIKLNETLKLKANLIKSNKEYDLALLQIEADGLMAIPMGNSDLAEAGDEVYAIGTPLETSLGQTVTRGIISGQRIIEGRRFLQTDVSINSGNSGGPIINDRGEVIGITTMKLEGKGIEGIGFCIPSNTVIEMLNIKF